MTDIDKGKAAQDAALAAWESTTMQNLSPRLTADESLDLWKAILAFREHRNVSELTAAARGAVPIHLVTIREPLDAALASLTVLFPEN